MAALKLNWKEILPYAADIVRSYDTSVTLRQLFYRLVSAQMIPNSDNAYKGLSRHTARARREGDFPDLIDPGRQIYRYQTFEDTTNALDWMRRIYRRKRDEHQEMSIYIGVEKLGMAEQLQAWFSELGIAIIVLRGYASQSYIDEIYEDVQDQGRRAVFIYAGDFDPSGEDIERDFLERTGCWDEAVRIALTPQQVIDYDLPPLPGKATDSRSAGFMAKHGQLVQVELDALDPADLRGLYNDALAEWWDTDAYERSMRQERSEDKLLARLTRATAEDVLLGREDAEALRDLAVAHAEDDWLEVARPAVDSIVKQLIEQDEADDDDGE